jgi:uncharacterized protein (DUF983 family)
MQVSRKTTAFRALRGKCPNCGKPGVFARPFYLATACRHCGLPFDRERGFTLGTTSIGYVVAIILIFPPIIFFTVMGTLDPVHAVILGVIGSFAIPTLLYPFLLRCVVAMYFASLAHELPVNTGRPFAEGDHEGEPARPE